MAGKLMQIQNLIYEIRGQKVILDRDLAELYGVEVKRLNEAVKRNIERFPPDFMFQLTSDEWNSLRSQIVTANEGNSLRSQFATANVNISKVRFCPNAITEHGVLMLSAEPSKTKTIGYKAEKK
jgi:L-lactate utilization protein LutC